MQEKSLLAGPILAYHITISPTMLLRLKILIPGKSCVFHSVRFKFQSQHHDDKNKSNYNPSLLLHFIHMHLQMSTVPVKTKNSSKLFLLLCRVLSPDLQQLVNMNGFVFKPLCTEEFVKKHYAGLTCLKQTKVSLTILTKNNTELVFLMIWSV